MATIGIDLGTTNSLVSVYKDGKIVIIPNANGKNLTPSVVSLDGDTALVGDSAKERLITFPDSTASCFKRTMGQEFFYQLNNQTFSSVELSSLILKNLKRDAEQFLGEEVKEAVISVPAYFNQFQRKATKDAAEIAGLKVERLISEPTAAALAYGVQNREDMNTILVFDLGGGTFDISLLELFDGVIDVKAVSGDNKLGGEDFTRSIAAWYISENNIDVKSISTEDMSKIIKTAEIAKRNISTPDSSLVQMSLNIGGKDYNSVLTQDTFKQITSDLMQRLVNPIKKVLQDQALERDEVDLVILMGGSTKMPIVQEFVKNLFGSDKVVSSYNPDETVALGAGILAAMKDNNQSFKETVLTDICSFSLGVAVHNDFSSFESKSEFSPIIERNSPIPISIVKQYFGSYQGQAQVLVKIYQGESLNLDEDIFLGEIEVPLPTDKIPKVDIRFTYDINSLLEVEVTNANDEKKSIVLNNSSSGMTEEEKKAAQKNMEKLKIVPWEQEENRALLEKGKRLYSETVGEKRETVKQVLDAFMKVLSSQNPIEIKKAYKSTKQIFDSLESEW